uniref:Transposase (Putative), gypsy type n=1 Tax=Tanacetum cinerariifolium TaxID=118510 RepID=A0A699GPP1_TANCI|nr:hypothetical protein [Tanacetum cinerariifolium]
MSEYLRFPFFFGALVVKGAVVSSKNRQTSTPLLISPWINLFRTRPTISSKWRWQNLREFETQPKKRKASTVRKDRTTSFGHVLFPIRTIAPTGPAVEVRSDSDGEDDETQHALEDSHLSTHPSPRESANESVHNYVDIDGDLHMKDGESSRSGEIYIPGWSIPRRCRVDYPVWCREMMVHLAPPVAQEESNALPNHIALDRAWFTLARRAMAQTDILERKLVTARQDLKHNAKLYTDMANRYMGLKEEHLELEAELARKDSALAVAEKIGQSSPQSHEYKKSLSEPFNMAIQAKGNLGEVVTTCESAYNFDAYSYKKLYPMYDKLFEKEYHFIMKIASGYRHSVSDLLKVHHDPAPSGGTSAPTISTSLAEPQDLSVYKET